MPFPPTQKTMEGLLKDTGERLTLVERRLAVGGVGGGGEPATIHPTGDVWQVTDATLPAGTLWCDGRAVSRTTYAALFAEVGTKYGAGDGSTTFNLPNLNGRELMVPGPGLARWNLSNVFVPLSAAEGAASVPDTYEIRAQFTIVSAAMLPRMRFSTNGVDQAGTGYQFSRMWVNAASLQRAYNGAVSMVYLGSSASGRQTLQMMVQRAGAADYTDFTWDHTERNTPDAPMLMSGTGWYGDNTAFDGITFFNEAGPMAGFLQVIPFGGSMVPSVIATTPIMSGVVGAGSTDGGGGTYKALAGLVQAWDSNIIPSGWLLCDGSLVSRAAYPELFAAIGTIHGVGDGSTTFALPNYKGRTLVGRDAAQTEFDTLGEVGGTKAVTLTVAQMPSHDHSPSYNSSPQGAGLNGNVYAYGSGTDGMVRPVAMTAEGGDQAHENMPPYAVANWIISTGSGLGGGGTNIPAQLWQEFHLAATSGTAAAPGNQVVWDGPVAGNLGATLSADKKTITLPAAGTYRILPHIGIAGSPAGAANANADINGAGYAPSFGYGTSGPAGAWSYDTEFYITVTGPTTLRYAINPAALYFWSWLRVEKQEPIYVNEAMAVSGRAIIAANSKTPATSVGFVVNWSAFEGPAGVWSAAQPARFILNKPGKWRVYAKVRMTDAASGYGYLNIWKNSAIVSQTEGLDHYGVAGCYPVTQDIVTSNGTDFIEIVATNSNGNQTIIANNSLFTLEWIGA